MCCIVKLLFISITVKKITNGRQYDEQIFFLSKKAFNNYEKKRNKRKGAYHTMQIMERRKDEEVRDEEDVAEEVEEEDVR